MKIIETLPHDDYEGTWELKMNTDTFEQEISFGCGEPEDMVIGRDLNDVYSIEEMLRAAYEAGKRGESYEYESITEEE